MSRPSSFAFVQSLIILWLWWIHSTPSLMNADELWTTTIQDAENWELLSAGSSQKVFTVGITTWVKHSETICYFVCIAHLRPRNVNKSLHQLTTQGFQLESMFYLHSVIVIDCPSVIVYIVGTHSHYWVLPHLVIETVGCSQNEAPADEHARAQMLTEAPLDAYYRGESVLWGCHPPILPDERNKTRTLDIL